MSNRNKSTANNVAICLVVSMKLISEGKSLVLEMMDTCQEQIESERAQLLGYDRYMGSLMPQLEMPYE